MIELQTTNQVDIKTAEINSNVITTETQANADVPF